MIVYIPCNVSDEIICLENVPKDVEFGTGTMVGTEELIGINFFVAQDNEKTSLNSRASIVLSEYANDNSIQHRFGNIMICDVDAFSVPVHVTDSDKLELLKLCMREVSENLIFLEPEEAPPNILI